MSSVDVSKAVKEGILVRPKRCERCGKAPGRRKGDGISKIHAHHENYDRPLDVNWFCVRCHSIRHTEMEIEGKDARNPRSGKRDRAHAHLVATAPEMLAVCETILREHAAGRGLNKKRAAALQLVIKRARGDRS